MSGGFAQREMVNPTVLTAAEAAATPLAPVYPQTEGINSAYLTKLVRQAFAAGTPIDDPLPPALRQKYKLCGKAEAVRMIHFPQDLDEVAQARRRLIFEELLALQLGLLLLRGRGCLLYTSRCV